MRDVSGDRLAGHSAAGADALGSCTAMRVEVSSPDDPDAVARNGQVWEDRCPTFLALTEPTPVDVAF